MMRTIWLINLFVTILAFGVGSSRADDSDFTVAPNVQSLNFAAGEAQSTIVPPGKKSQCTKGRIFITDDWTRPGGATVTGAVHWRDLAGAAEGESTHDPVPNFQPGPSSSPDYWFQTNDHDIVALPNGDIIYEIGAGSKRPLTPAPAWFNFAFRGAFGPGARSTILVWRSEDCGESFKFVSEIDSAGAGHEDCAYPQGSGVVVDESSGAKGVFKAAPTLIYDLGGTDGQWLGIDRQGGKLVLVEQCVGRIPLANSKPFRLSDNYVSKTYVFTSANEGSTWQQSAGSLPDSVWRISGVAVAGKRIVMTIGAGVRVGTASSNGSGWDFGGFDAVQTGVAGYSNMNAISPWKELRWDPTTNPNGVAWYNIINSSSSARVPNSNWVVLAAPETVPVPPPNGAAGSNKFLNQQHPGPWTNTFGSGLYFYDPDAKDAKKVKSTTPILPASPTLGSAIMHLTAIDPGSGPVLLYWYDVDGYNKAATIRGRFILGPDQLSEDFDISRTAGNGASFSLMTAAGLQTPYFDAEFPQRYFYGDYKSAGGFAQSVFNNGPKTKYRYFPVWVEPDGSMYYTEVSVLVPAAAAPGTFNISGLPIQPATLSAWHKVQRLANATHVPWAREVEEHERMMSRGARQFAPASRAEPEAPPSETPPPAQLRPMRPLPPATPPRIQRMPIRPTTVEPPVQTSTLCHFSAGPRTGQTQDYAPMAPLPVGSSCQDARGSSGVVVAPPR